MSSTRLDLLKINAVAALLAALVFLAGACGTGIGNPGGDLRSPDQAPAGSSPAAEALDFDPPLQAYEASDDPDCGSFASSSASAEVEAGRSCIRSAFLACRPARYLLDQTVAPATRFVSFVSVIPPGDPSGPCRLKVHTVSSDASRFFGEASRTCDRLSAGEQIELACGIAG